MHKIITILLGLIFLFSSCEQPAGNNNNTKAQTITIVNESSFDLTNVKFMGLSFSVFGTNDLPVSSQAVQQITPDQKNKSGNIIFNLKNIPGVTCRTDLITVGDKNLIYKFRDVTVVEELNNSNNRKPLSQITFSRIYIERSGLSVVKNDIVPLGETVKDYISQHEFTIKNTGAGKLKLIGNEPVKINSSHDVFSVIQPSSSEINPNGSLTFRVNFAPKAVQPYSTQVTVYSDDNNGDFTFTIMAMGTVPKPIAVITYGETGIAQNGTINIGDVLISQSKTISVTIENKGTEVLTIGTSNITMTGADETAFIQKTDPGSSISVGSQTSFLIEFMPTKQGVNDATLVIPTNDNSRNPVIVFLRGTAIPSHTVSYDINNGTGITPDAQTIETDFSVTLASSSGITRTGYVFGGWNINADGMGANYNAGSSFTPTGSLTLYARWYSIVTFNANNATGGTVPAVMETNAGSSITLPGTGSLSRTGYAFGGWNTDAAGTGTNYNVGASYTPVGNITLYARWYSTVTFNANDATSGTTPTAIEVNAGSAIMLPGMGSLSRTSYTFGGWNTGASGTGTNYNTGASYTPTGNVTLYARWYRTINFDANNAASGTTPTAIEVNAGSGATLPGGSDLSKTDYIFGGWNTNAAGTGSNYNAGSYYTPTGDITLYARWLIVSYTVTFNADGGIPAPLQQTVEIRGLVTQPAAMTKNGYIFDGWYRESAFVTTRWNFATDTVTEGITLYAKWITVPGSNLAAKLEWLRSNAESNRSYIVEVHAIESIGPQTLPAGRNDLSIILKGIVMPRVVTLSANGSLFTVGSGVTLVLDDNITLRGRTNNASLVQVNSGGAVIMNAGSSIEGNTSYSSTGGGGVYVNGGTFTMNGGEVFGNTSSNGGGGVYMSINGGIFMMNSGKIFGNSATGGTYGNVGGGVYISQGTFTMNGGEIYSNTAIGGTSTGGGGVYVVSYPETFTMNGGEIYGNTATGGRNGNTGGGVYVNGGTYNGTFTMRGGRIYGNTADSGGGVGAWYGDFTMSNGEISDNTAMQGGGVYVGQGTFTMRGGEISGNTSSNGGGGVCMSINGGIFTKIGGGTIYGYSESDPVHSNTVKNSSGVIQSASGHAVYVGTNPAKRRETTAGPSVNLDSARAGAAGGWEN